MATRHTMSANRSADEEAMQMAHQIIDAFPEANALRLTLACIGVISIVTEETHQGNLAINTGRALIEIGESVNGKFSN